MIADGAKKVMHLFIGGLSQTCTHNHLRGYLSKYGKVQEVDLSKDYEVGLSHKGFAFAVLTDVHRHEGLIGQHEICGKKCEIKMRTNERIFLSNIPWDCTKEMITEAFAFYKISLSEIKLGDGMNGMPLGFGSVRIQITGTRAREWSPHALNKLGPFMAGSTVLKIESRYTGPDCWGAPENQRFYTSKPSKESSSRIEEDEDSFKHSHNVTNSDSKSNRPNHNVSKPEEKEPKRKKKGANRTLQPEDSIQFSGTVKPAIPMIDSKEIIEIIPKKKNKKHKNSHQSQTDSRDIFDDSLPRLQVSELRADEFMSPSLVARISDGGRQGQHFQEEKSQYIWYSCENSQNQDDQETTGPSLLELLHAQETVLNANSSMYPSEQHSGSFTLQNSQQDCLLRQLDSKLTQDTTSTSVRKLGLKEKLELRKQKQQAQNQIVEAQRPMDSIGSHLFTPEDPQKHTLSPFSEVYFPHEMGIFSVKPIPQSAPFYPEQPNQLSSRKPDSSRTFKPAILNPQSPPIFPVALEDGPQSQNWLKDRKSSADVETYVPSRKMMSHISHDAHAVFPSATRQLVFPFYAFPGFG